MPGDYTSTLDAEAAYARATAPADEPAILPHELGPEDLAPLDLTPRDGGPLVDACTAAIGEWQETERERWERWADDAIDDRFPDQDGAVDEFVLWAASLLALVVALVWIGVAR